MNAIIKFFIKKNKIFVRIFFLVAVRQCRNSTFSENISQNLKNHSKHTKNQNPMYPDSFLYIFNIIIIMINRIYIREGTLVYI